MVVAGGGLAGLRTVEELRARGYKGTVTLCGAERHPPYDRPPLSKQLLTGERDDTTLDADLAALGVDLRLGEAATGLAGGVLRTGGGEYPFDRLVVATGAAPIALPGDGTQWFLRTIDDALRLREAFRPGLRLAVIGAGWIGAELSTAAAARGCDVTVVEAAAAPLAAAIGTEVGSVTASWYEAAGVELRLGQAVESVQPGGIALSGGGWLDADEIVTAVGVRPQVSWLEGSGVKLDNGVLVDEGLRTTVPGVYAAGDCAAFMSRLYGRRLRFEHWDVALHAPEVAAANLLGGDEVYNPVPYFWSEQFGRMVQYAGYHGAAGRLVWRGDPAGRQWAVCWLAASPDEPPPPDPPAGSPGGPAHPDPPAGAERLVAILAVGRPRDVLQGRRVIASGAAVDAGKLADPDVPLRNATTD